MTTRPTIGQLTVTEEPEELVGLTCDVCAKDATHTLTLAHGTPEETTHHRTVRTCRRHVAVTAHALLDHPFSATAGR